MQKIAIHSVPRSGSTWLGNILNSHPEVSFKYQPLFSYMFKGYLNENSTSLEIDDFFNEIALSDDAFINQKEGLDKGIIPLFEKSKNLSHSSYKEVRYHHILENMLQQSKSIKVILLIRNPLAVLQSWYQAPREFRAEKGWIFEEEWFNAEKKNLNRREEFHGYAKWKEATELFLKLNELYPSQVLILKYSDLLIDINKEIDKVFKFCNLEMHNQTIDFLRTSKSLNHQDSYSVYKKRDKDDNWKLLPQFIIDYILKDLKNTNLEQFLNE